MIPSRSSPFVFICPACGETLTQEHDVMTCPADSSRFVNKGGVWRFLSDDRRNTYQPFIKDYEKIRAAEGRNQQPSAWYRSLPNVEDDAGWKIRATSYATLLKHVIQPMTEKPLKVVDLGAGNGWLSNRLSEHGHRVVAVDLLVNDWDGLGAHHHYGTTFTRVQAEYDHIPFASTQFDLVIYNAAFHYSTSYQTTLREACRVLRPDGSVVIMDTPIYHDARSGAQMVTEREAQFQLQYGTPSNHLPSENYLTYQRLAELGSETGVQWRIIKPFFGIKWALRPLRAKLRGHREPAKFHVICGRRL
jgi:ubiquinone/menaquinone biosynthesis C-methylase UbiE